MKDVYAATEATRPVLVSDRSILQLAQTDLIVQRNETNGEVLPAPACPLHQQHPRKAPARSTHAIGHD
ncbi:hypothetical protein D3C76_1489760 [compost metagenome]